MKLRELSIIQYQNVSSNPQVSKLWLSLDSFKKQLTYLAAHDFQLLSIDDALDFMERKKSVESGRPIALTFDNGYQDFQEHVYPLLCQYGYPATLLISPLRVGKSRKIENTAIPYLSWKTLRELVQNNVTVGAFEDHSLAIHQVPEDVLKQHIVDHKNMLEDELGLEIRYFGIKEGIPNRAVRELVASQGYRAFLTQCPTYRRPNLDWVGRIQVDDDDFNIFLTKISSTYLFFKDKKSWKYIRKFKLDRVGHRASAAYDQLRRRGGPSG
ncbi:MAG: polysaccharide deacetylase family protein [Acidobacteria bacterium]|nr:polysaccharide deacetylase family protein [Acidobacteriota bacterium]